ncbi:hypothetical protein [Vibrio diabolicus]|uniref:hypothetical protein n=2 Tax=Vibrionaceae TaxID=641 RepID=UPI00106E1D1C|nr:hypothetical protein [Vibrio diabolicus]
MKKLTICSLIMGSLLSSGCSTITNGSNEQISFSSREEGTKLFIDGKYYGKDHASITVPRGEAHTVVAQKTGCEQTSITTDYSFQWGKSLFLNFLIDFGIISIPTDLLTGSAWETDSNHYEVTPNCPTDSTS